MSDTTDSLIEGAAQGLRLNGRACSDRDIAALLLARLELIYNTHCFYPADAEEGETCWCPECGESGPYPNPCTTARIVVGDRDEEFF